MAQPPVQSLLLSSESWCVQCFVCALQVWSPWFPLSCESLVTKSYWLSRSCSLGIPRPFVGSPGSKARSVTQNLHNSGRTSLVLLFSSLWITHLVGMGFDFIMIVPLLQSRCSFFFVFGRGVSFFLVGSSILLSMAVQQLVGILALSQEEMNACPSTLLSETRRLG